MLALAAFAFSSSSFAADSGEPEVLPTPEELPAGVVAFVGSIAPEMATLTDAELTRAIGQVAAQSHRRSVPSAGQPRYAALSKEALAERLDAIWIQGQAAEMGIAATERQVSTELAKIKRNNFKSKREYQAFLKSSRLTQRDVRERIALQILSTRIQLRVLRSPAGRKNPRQTLADFIADYTKRWRSRTVCAPAYATERCANGPSRSRPAAAATRRPVSPTPPRPGACRANGGRRAGASCWGRSGRRSRPAPRIPVGTVSPAAAAPATAPTPPRGARCPAPS